MGATGFENAESDSVNCGEVSPSEFLDGKMGEGDQAGEAEDVEKWVPCALKGTAEDPLEEPITRQLWGALASWSKEPDVNELRRRILALMSVIG